MAIIARTNFNIAADYAYLDYAAEYLDTMKHANYETTQEEGSVCELACERDGDTRPLPSSPTPSSTSPEASVRVSERDGGSMLLLVVRERGGLRSLGGGGLGGCLDPNSFDKTTTWLYMAIMNGL